MKIFAIWLTSTFLAASGLQLLFYQWFEPPKVSLQPSQMPLIFIYVFIVIFHVKPLIFCSGSELEITDIFYFPNTTGRMVYVSSIFAFFNCLNMGAYSVSKRGLEAFADCLRVEMASFGVEVM